jgi:hypothetical protein
MAIIKAGNPLTLETTTSLALIMPEFVISAEYRDRPAIVPSKLTQDEVQELERHDKMQFSEG